MKKDTMGRWIVDELVFDPHLDEGGRVVVRDGAEWHIIDGRRPDAEPVPYKAKMSPDYPRPVANWEWAAYNCAPRAGFRIAVGRAATEEEFASVVERYGLNNDTISDPHTVTLGGIYGPEAEVKVTSRQIKVEPGQAIPLESELLSMGIQASSRSPGRVDIRVSEYMASIGRKGGSVTGEAKSEAAKARNAARKAEGKPEGGRPPKARPE